MKLTNDPLVTGGVHSTEDNDKEIVIAELKFKKKQDWKDKVVFPKWLEHVWVARDANGKVYLYKQRPIVKTGDSHWVAVDANWFFLHPMFFDRSFFPKEFWECDFRDSLLEVKHES